MTKQEKLEALAAELLCATKQSTTELRLAVSDFKTILDEIKGLK